ncbi:MAG: [FeFe] hydrogenase H-cluster radical SAM maturase HydG [Nitrospirae bacterium]|nr:[FeFe] hydrogenase H-cluster radical SAM maturase HydG [Nitrospirota bacterium]
MCYAIPGKVLEINNNTALIEYFGEKKTALVDAGDVSVGDYVYAQGGFIVQTVEADEAHGILNEWEDIFFKLKERDEMLAGKASPSVSTESNIERIITKGEAGERLTRDELLALLRCRDRDELNLLYRTANRIRHKVHRNSSCVHGIIEFSNICKNDCAYCGIRKDNDRLQRYRMTADEIVDTAVLSAEGSGFRAFVLQSGEDGYYTTERLIEIIQRIKARHGVLIFLSIGERDEECYRRLYEAGARGVLLRFETSNREIYSRLHTTLHFDNRLKTLRMIRDMGYIIATGSLTGLPGQSEEDMLNDILLAKSFGTEMYSFGPFIAHPQTPLASANTTDLDTMLKVIAVTRLVHHDGNILVTSAVETLFGREGAEKALMAGGNSMMINLTPDKFRKLYSIYPGKGEKNKEIQERISETISLLYSLGRAPTDIGISGGTLPPLGKGGMGGFERRLSSEIELILNKTRNASAIDIEGIIENAKKLNGLTLEETAILLQCKDRGLTELLYSTAEEVKKAIYGNRLVLFAPLYLTSECINNCLYCGFRKDNSEIERKTLTEVEIRSECEAIIRDGHKRVLVVAGEDPRTSAIDYLERSIAAIYSTRADNGSIRRINVNVAPLGVEEYRRLKVTGIGTYQLFQETYHKQTYKEMHPSGPKHNYDYRISALGRAMEAGIDDVGMGVLFGLYDYRFEVLALLRHARELERQYGVGPHTVSVPRIEPASGAPLSVNPPHAVSDEDFMKIIAILRLAIPYTGIILSTREDAGLRDRLFHIGVSQISTNSRTYPGGYSAERVGMGTVIPTEVGIQNQAIKGQFTTGDKRTTGEVIKHIAKDGFAPSFCTACYRTGRTGHEFMEFAKPGEIQRFCLPNSILSFKEYVLDYGDEELRKTGEELIHAQTASIEDPKLRNATIKKLDEIEQGKRDLYF